MLILASNSPRRKEILLDAGYDFIILPAKNKEIVIPGLTPQDTAIYLAEKKAKEIFDSHNEDTVIGADTIVCLGNTVMGKPEDENAAYEMLRALSGKTHSVYTGVCIISASKSVSFYEETKVEFYDLSDTEILSYIATKESFDKAGSYGIQGNGALFVKKIEGDYFNVVGLPISKVYRALNTFNVYNKLTKEK